MPSRPIISRKKTIQSGSAAKSRSATSRIACEPCPTVVSAKPPDSSWINAGIHDSFHVSSQAEESRAAQYTQHKQHSLTNETALTVHKESSIDSKLFAINDLECPLPDCPETSHSCSDCGHRLVCLETAQPASFSSPRCPVVLNPLIPQQTDRINCYATMKLPISAAVTTTQSLPSSRTPLKSIYEGSKSLRKQKHR